MAQITKSFRRDPRVRQTLFRPHHRRQLTAAPLSVPKRQEGDLGYENGIDDLTSLIQAVVVRWQGWWPLNA